MPPSKQKFLSSFYCVQARKTTSLRRRTKLTRDALDSATSEGQTHVQNVPIHSLLSRPDKLTLSLTRV